MAKYVAGVDSSTQSTKVLVVDSETGNIVRQGSAKHPDGTECHPDYWYNAFLEAVEGVNGLDDIEAISVGGQQHGMVLLDSCGEVIRPALLWNDTRSARAAEDLIAELGGLFIAKSPAAFEDGHAIDNIGAKAWADAIGSVLVASITVTKIRWVAAHEPQNAKRIAAVCLPHDWLSWRIAGYGPKSQGLEPNFDALWTDRSDASGTGYFDCEKNEYRRDLLELALRPLSEKIGEDGVKELAQSIHLPKVVKCNEIGAKSIGVEGVIKAGLPVGPGCGDNAGAALGLGLKPGEVSVSLGTSGVVAAISPVATHDKSGAINGFADATGNFLPLACTLNASRIVDSAKEILGASYDEVGELALNAEPGADGLTLVPYFEGERVPNRPTANATLFGMTLANTTRENIARAFVEGMLSGQNDGLVLMQKLGVPIEKVFMIGGSMKSPAVRAIAPAVFGRDITLPVVSEYVALGAAKQAAWILDPQDTPPVWERTGEEVISAPATPVVNNQYELVKDLQTMGELQSK
ncbi:MAG: xylulose kinase [Candidatus Ancillula sp.]|jgi:xylulokinase|nr:xylulose kinase [Candidatus Ancillula sp.]